MRLSRRHLHDLLVGLVGGRCSSIRLAVVGIVCFLVAADLQPWFIVGERSFRLVPRRGSFFVSFRNLPR